MVGRSDINLLNSMSTCCANKSTCGANNYRYWNGQHLVKIYWSWSYSDAPAQESIPKGRKLTISNWDNKYHVHPPKGPTTNLYFLHKLMIFLVGPDFARLECIIHCVIVYQVKSLSMLPSGLLDPNIFVWHLAEKRSRDRRRRLGVQRLKV